MRGASAAWTTALAQGGGGGGGGGGISSSKPRPGAPWSLLLALLAFGASSCKGTPVASHVLQGEKMWNKINGICSAYLARDTLPQFSNTLEELCLMVLEFLQKNKELVEKDNTEKPLVANSLLGLVPELHERRQKRYKVDEELRIPGGVQSRGYFMFRPRNGRRSATLY